MDSGGTESGEDEGSVEEDDKDSQKGGGGAAGVHIFLQIYHSVGASLWRRDMGGYPPHGPVTWGFPGPGGAVIDVASPTAVGRR